MSCDNKIPLISIVGPTASGKTSLAIKIAKIFDGEIVSADSMQIYKGMDIATAKPTKSELVKAKHHLVSFLDDDKSFSVAQYCEMAKDVIFDIHKRGKTPILVGGTGLYIDSLINNTAFSECDSDEVLREELFNLATSNGVEYLLAVLEEFDPQMAYKLSVEKNIKRIIRAIEVYKLTGVTMTEHNAQSHKTGSPYHVVKIGLTASDRQFLYDRINKRVDVMVESGLIEEAKSNFCKKLSNTAAMAIGHKELAPFFRGDLSVEKCIDNLKMQTRRYAKRQLTWFKRDENINWFYIDLLSEEELLNNVVLIIEKVLFNEKR